MANKKGFGKRRSGTRNRNFITLPVQTEFSLGTLADNTVLRANLTALAQDIYWISADLSISIRDLTPGEGLIGFGLCHNELSVTEILEALTALPISQSDIVALEQARRPVRKMGQFAGLAEAEVWNDGKRKRIRTGFMINEGIECGFYAENLSGASLTTGVTILIEGNIYAVWK